MITESYFSSIVEKRVYQVNENTRFMKITKVYDELRGKVFCYHYYIGSVSEESRKYYYEEPKFRLVYTGDFSYEMAEAVMRDAVIR